MPGTLSENFGRARLHLAVPVEVHVEGDQPEADIFFLGLLPTLKGH